MRRPCVEDPETGDCDRTENHITNSKAFMVANVGIGSWSGRMDVVKYEAHDTGLAIEALESGFYIDQMSVACRTGELLKLPEQRADYIQADGFTWYVTSNSIYGVPNSFLVAYAYASFRLGTIPARITSLLTPPSENVDTAVKSTASTTPILLEAVVRMWNQAVIPIRVPLVS